MGSREDLSIGIEHIYNPAEQQAIIDIANKVIEQVDENTPDLDISNMVDDFVVGTVLQYGYFTGHQYSPIKADKEKVAKEKIIAKIKRSLSTSDTRKPITSENIGKITLEDLPPARRDEAVALVNAMKQFYSEPRNVGRPVHEAIDISMRKGQLRASDLVQQIVAREYAKISANIKEEVVENDDRVNFPFLSRVKGLFKGFRLKR